jgi:hypothetical protein
MAGQSDSSEGIRLDHIFNRAFGNAVSVSVRGIVLYLVESKRGKLSSMNKCKEQSYGGPCI